MKLSRPRRVFAALITLFCLLFTQLAVASYVCPNESVTPGAAAMAAMPGCQDMGMHADLDQPGLCKAHCEAGHQSLDTPGAPHVAPFVAAALAVVLLDRSIEHVFSSASGADLLTRSTAPPLAIQHCCFRI